VDIQGLAAIEVTYQGSVLHSKLKCGKFPEPSLIADALTELKWDTQNARTDTRKWADGHHCYPYTVPARPEPALAPGHADSTTAANLIKASKSAVRATVTAGAVSKSTAAQPEVQSHREELGEHTQSKAWGWGKGGSNGLGNGIRCHR
jgi:hypothetical protein